ncbi:MAG: hypothetical protein Q8922_03785 [Bacteroidota bacterium]|nr:hypothetical protein [Bacteroidota bacterium]MDP4233414.1 hypothetical protein [Bacteroidota bacterium]MDP4242280.1 hypothetical protein [Bacteroidota bacterium]MDP4287036.1 hypothetical protein [Bacteroidota bacterium]
MRIAIFLAACFLVSCSSKTVTRTSNDQTSRTSTAAAKAPFKFSFRISGSGLENKPYDMLLMDTNHMMGVHTTKRGKDGKFHTINALAQLEPADFDTLQQLIIKGRLYAIDSADVTQVCPEDELYQMDIVPLAEIKPVRLDFSACAADYNLLLQPERTYFRRIIDWFERIRVKYRPEQPE